MFEEAFVLLEPSSSRASASLNVSSQALERR